MKRNVAIIVFIALLGIGTQAFLSVYWTIMGVLLMVSLEVFHFLASDEDDKSPAHKGIWSFYGTKQEQSWWCLACHCVCAALMFGYFYLREMLGNGNFIEGWKISGYGITASDNFVIPQRSLYMLVGLLVIRIIAQIVYVIRTRHKAT